MNTANRKPEAVAPHSSPMTPAGPSSRPPTMGTPTAMRVGTTISFRLALVHRSTHRAKSASAVPWMMPGISLNCRRTSSTTLWAALPTLPMVMAAKMKARQAPTKMPTSTTGFMTLISSAISGARVSTFST